MPSNVCVPTAVPACVRARFGLSPFYVKFIDVQRLRVRLHGRHHDPARPIARAAASPGQASVLDPRLQARSRVPGRLGRLRGRAAPMSQARLRVRNGRVLLAVSISRVHAQSGNGHVPALHGARAEILWRVAAADIFDNMKAVVLSHAPHATVFNRRFLEYTKARGFAAVACNPGKGNEKGRVERPIGFVRTGSGVAAAWPTPWIRFAGRRVSHGSVGGRKSGGPVCVGLRHNGARPTDEIGAIVRSCHRTGRVALVLRLSTGGLSGRAGAAIRTAVIHRVAGRHGATIELGTVAGRGRPIGSTRGAVVVDRDRSVTVLADLNARHTGAAGGDVVTV
jgi:hypothetical protein